MNLKFEKLAQEILGEGYYRPTGTGHTNRSLEAFKSRERNAGLEKETANQPYKIRVTWKSGGKSFLKANGEDVVYRGDAGYRKAEAKCKSLKETNPKVEDAVPVPVGTA